MNDIYITGSIYASQETTCAGTIVERLVRMGISSLETAIARPSKSSQHTSHDGVVEHFIKPWSEQHILTVMLTKSS